MNIPSIHPLAVALLALFLCSCGKDQKSNSKVTASEPIKAESIIAELSQHPSLNKTFLDQLTLRIKGGYVEIRYNSVKIAMKNEGDVATMFGVMDSQKKTRNKINTIIRLVAAMEGVKDVNVINEAD